MTDLSRAIALPGFVAEALLGSGGFAEVFRYRQELPKRQVAIKVLNAQVSDPVARSVFEHEANLMASLSSHPAIVTIHQVGISEGDRPYLVMEYCSKPNLEQRSKAGPMPVNEALSLMIRLSGAVETAHRAGILHLDIKPANVLTTDFGWPALTDFGIAQLIGQGQSATEGLSLPWASPEAVRGQELSPATDVYSLAATLYTLLASQAPFGDSTQGQNQLIRRITSEAVSPIDRVDLPAPLHRILEAGLAKLASERPQSALEFGRALQAIEQELGLSTTPIDVPDELLEDLERTRAGFRGTGADAATEIDDETVLSSRSVPTEPDDSTIQVKRARKQAKASTESDIPDDQTVRRARKTKATPAAETPMVAADEAQPATDPRILIPKPADEKQPEGYRIREFTPKSSIRVAPGPAQTTVTAPANVHRIAEQRRRHLSRRNRGLAILVSALILSGALMVVGIVMVVNLLG